MFQKCFNLKLFVFEKKLSFLLQSYPRLSRVDRSLPVIFFPLKMNHILFNFTGAAFLGWIIGKFSYARKCEDKFVNLENSTIGKAIRRKRGYVSDR